jgi:DNA-directed RNA polymerase specialized sigma24 family protein
MSQLGMVREVDGEAAASEESPIAAGEPPRSGEALLLEQELARLYSSFVESLGSPVREFFVARFEERLTQVEAGKRCGLSHMQARTQEKKLRKQFLKHMQAQGYLEGAREAGGASADSLRWGGGPSRPSQKGGAA